MAKELVTGFSEKKARFLRNAIVHGSGESVLSHSRRSVRKSRPDELIHILNASFPQYIRCSSIKSGRILGDYGISPNASSGIYQIQWTSKQILLIMASWFEGVQRFQVQSGVQEKDRLRSARFVLEWELDGRQIESISKEGFKRDADEYSPDRLG